MPDQPPAGAAATATPAGQGEERQDEGSIFTHDASKTGKAEPVTPAPPAAPAAPPPPGNTLATGKAPEPTPAAAPAPKPPEAPPASPNHEANEKVRQEGVKLDDKALDDLREFAKQNGMDNKALAALIKRESDKLPQPPAPPSEDEKKAWEERRKAGVNLTDEQFAAIKKFGAEKNLAPEALKAIEEHQALLIARAEQAWPETQKAWLKEFAEDTEFGGSRLKESAEGAARVVAKFGNAKFRALLENGLGNNPDVNRFLASIYYAGLAEDRYTPPTPPPPGPGDGQAPVDPQTEAARELFGKSMFNEDGTPKQF